MTLSAKEIARAFQELGDLMDLHGESSFKIKAYQNAYLVLRKLGDSLVEMPAAELQHIKGIGAAIAEKVRELVETGRMEVLENYRANTPEGVREMLGIKGLGPKKIRVIWEQLGVTSVGELEYACLENRLITLDGFGKKTQDDIVAKIRFFRSNSGLSFYALVRPVAEELLERLRSALPGERIELTGPVRRMMPVVDAIDILTTSTQEEIRQALGADAEATENGSDQFLYRQVRLRVHSSGVETWGTDWVRTTGDAAFLEAIGLEGAGPARQDEAEVFSDAGRSYIRPEQREQLLLDYPKRLATAPLSATDIRGVLHAHSTYSDGLHALQELAEHCRGLGYSYLGITDHSRSAIYANGLSVERLQEQWAEIDRLNAGWTDFRIFKGIESDILNDGRLDYPDEVLAGFDFVIASVHSVLQMDEVRATERLIRAIAHPATRILGHPTGRLLLSRKGYPIDHREVIRAAASHDVAIEINSNPHRLDLDWTWVPYALEQGVRLSINPDAHSIAGVDDIRWGIPVALKAGLDAVDCLCCWEADRLSAFFSRSY